MEFAGEITFADESQWLTLTTDTDDTVTVSVTVDGESLSFAVTPSSGVTRLPVGEIVRTLAGGGSLAGLTVTATQGGSTCSYTASVYPCRKFEYSDLDTAVFSGRPKSATTYKGAKEVLPLLDSSLLKTTVYIRFILRAGVRSESYIYFQANSAPPRLYALDISADTALSLAADKGLDTSAVKGYEVWLATSNGKSDIYTFAIGTSRLPLRTYKFLGQRGMYEYIHATGSFGRSVETETQVFVEGGSVERELGNDSSMTFEQSSGHIGSAGEGSFWLQFFAAKERYIVESDGTERLIIVDDCDPSLTDLEVGGASFTWHYANPNNTVAGKTEVAITDLAVNGVSTVNDSGNSSKYTVTYTPTGTTQRGVGWSIVGGSAYASIDQTGKLTVKVGAAASAVTVRATSVADSTIYAEKVVTVTYVSTYPSITFGNENISVTSTAGTATNTCVTMNLSNLKVYAAGTIGLTASISVNVITLTFTENSATSAKSATVTVSGTRTDGGGAFSRSFTVTQAAADVVALTGLTISGADSVTENDSVTLTAVYSPSDTTQTGVKWSIVSGSDYVAIGDGATSETVTIVGISGAAGNSATVRCSSTVDQSIYVEKTIPVMAAAVQPEIYGSDAVDNTNNYAIYEVEWNDVVQREVAWFIYEGEDYASIDQTGKLTVKSGASGNTVTIRCSSDDGTVDIFKTVTVTYNAVSSQISVSPSTVTTSSAKNDYQRIYIYSSGSWTSASVGWARCSRTSGDKAEDTILIYSYEANATGATRRQTLTFTDSNNGTTCELTVIQEG